MINLTNKYYPHIVKEIKDWSIVRFCSDIAAFKKNLVESVYNDLIEKYGDNLKTELENCAYSELNRLKTSPWKIDPPGEVKIWTEMRKDLMSQGDESDTETYRFLLRRIINRYVEEIVGDFKENTYLWIIPILAIFMNRIFNANLKGSILNPFKRAALRDKLKIAGYVEEVRLLYDKGLVILLPTHQSNLDSPLVGYTLYCKAGLPGFSYGAGLNLFNYEIPAYFMARLGAYKVDRRKKNSIYINTLLAYSKYSLVENVNTIFFPGGTRSRNGEIETDLKTGLMSTLVGAQYEKLVNGDSKKIFVVPVVLNYNSILEARSLIYYYLRKSGKTKFVTGNERVLRSSSTWRIIRYIFRVLGKKSEFILSFGKPMDVFGNATDVEGNSLDPAGNIIDISDYFKREGIMVSDSQRESVYTQILAKNVAESYLQHNVVLCSNVIAYAAYKCFLEELRVDDVFSFFKYEEKNVNISKENLLVKIDETMQKLLQMEKEGRIILADELKAPIDDIFSKGLKKLGVFHIDKVLYRQKKGILKTGDFGLLYYYSNRLSFLNK